MIASRTFEVRLDVRCDACKFVSRTLVKALPANDLTPKQIESALADLEDQACAASKRLQLLGEKRRHICPRCEEAIAPVVT